VRRRVTLVLGSAFALVAAAPAAAAEVQVRGLDTFAWDQPSVAIALGDTVKWSFEPAQPHNVDATSANWADFKSLAGKPAPPTQYTFTAEGVYTYVCEIHSDVMRGTVTVGSPPPPPPPPLSEQPFPNDSAVTTAALEIGGLDTAKPTLQNVAAKRSGKRVKVSFRVSEQSVVTVRFRRGGKTVKTKKASTAGRGSVTVAQLKAGRYSVKLTATDVAGNASRSRSASFRIR
jgi:plastocyanin